MTVKIEDDDSDVIRTWEPHAIIYEHDSRSFEAYLVLEGEVEVFAPLGLCLLYTSPSPRDLSTSRMPSSA